MGFFDEKKDRVGKFEKIVEGKSKNERRKIHSPIET